MELSPLEIELSERGARAYAAEMVASSLLILAKDRGIPLEQIGAVIAALSESLPADDDGAGTFGRTRARLQGWRDQIERAGVAAH